MDNHNSNDLSEVDQSYVGENLTPKTQIYILCRDRLDYAREAIHSAVQQDVEDVEVVVSDNSDQAAVGEMIFSEFPTVKYIRRNPVLGPLEHFRAVIQESKSEYVVFFHDDDVLYKSYVREMRAVLNKTPDVVAVGCNAKILRSNKKTDRLFMTSASSDFVLTCSEDLLDYYLRFNIQRAAPFPGYMYRRNAIEGLYLNAQDGGKHADVTFLMSIIKRGNILWLAKPLMRYRMHATNDSTIEQVGHRLRLLRFIYRNTVIKPKSPAVQEYRFRYWTRWLLSVVKKDNLNLHQWRTRIVFGAICRQAFCYALTKPGLWVRIISGAK